MTDANYADDLTLFANAPTQAESLLHCLEQAATGNIGIYVNAIKQCLFILKKKEPSASEIS